MASILAAWRTAAATGLAARVGGASGVVCGG
ncbi:Uncharacterised protein [Gordonia paraffinivorans]|uniref:Uncharacterized protein n=1 Tax=Gordonia paraffinivorans TaxID=175628 RepID=A0ABD7V677_9ACTN|nr:Uncharacterised protein [Gordonia paraffinivorans]